VLWAVVVVIPVYSSLQLITRTALLHCLVVNLFAGVQEIPVSDAVGQSATISQTLRLQGGNIRIFSSLKAV
jgi:hypothetical protein